MTAALVDPSTRRSTVARSTSSSTAAVITRVGAGERRRSGRRVEIDARRRRAAARAPRPPRAPAGDGRRRRASTPAGPPAVTPHDGRGCSRAAHDACPTATGSAAVGYHDRWPARSTGGGSTQLGIARPVRVQHRAGALWVLNSAALARGSADDGSGVLERDADGGRPTGRLYRRDDRLASLVPPAPLDLGRRRPALRPLRRHRRHRPHPHRRRRRPRRCSARPSTAATCRSHVDRHRRAGAARRRRPELAARAGEGRRRRPRLPDLDVVVEPVPGRPPAPAAPVAVHCVTRVALVLAWRRGTRSARVDGDRIEHGAVIPVELIGGVRELGLTVVTQPASSRERGDQYLAEVDPEDLPHLWRCGSLLDAGVEVGVRQRRPVRRPRSVAHVGGGASTGGRRRVRCSGPASASAPAVALDRMLGDPSIRAARGGCSSACPPTCACSTARSPSSSRPPPPTPWWPRSSAASSTTLPPPAAPADR